MNSLYRLHSVFVTFVIGVMVLAGCKPQVPSQFLQPDDMEDILYDYYLSQSMARYSDKQDFNQSIYYQAVLKKHGVTEAEFDSSLVYYYTHADRLGQIYSSLSERMNREAVSLGASVSELGKYAGLSATGDTANIWHDRTMVMLLPVAPYNRMDFMIAKDSTFRKGDSFQLNMKVDFMFQSGYKDCILYVAVDYVNDSTAIYQTRVTYSGMCNLSIPGNTELDIKQLRGFIFLGQSGDESNMQKLMFINGIQLIRFHPQASAPEQENLGDADSAVAVPVKATDDTKPVNAASEEKPAAQLVKIERMPIGAPLKPKNTK